MYRGFILQGQSKRVGIRGLGPSILIGGVPILGSIADPLLELHAATGATIFFNDNWRTSQAAEIQNSGLAPGSDLEAALIATLPAGNYTAVLRDTNGSTGIGLIEVYDLDLRGNSQLLNLSARAYVGAGDDVLIGGLIVQSVSRRLLLRALGPELAAHGVTGELGIRRWSCTISTGRFSRATTTGETRRMVPISSRPDWLQRTIANPRSSQCWAPAPIPRSSAAWGAPA